MMEGKQEQGLEMSWKIYNKKQRQTNSLCDSKLLTVTRTPVICVYHVEGFLQCVCTPLITEK